MYPVCEDCVILEAFFVIRNIPCPPLVSLHPRSSERVLLYRAKVLIIFAHLGWVIRSKNHVLEKKVFMYLLSFLQ